jgi:hypothetical protein
MIRELEKAMLCWALVAHTCNPNYPGGRDEKDCDLKPDQDKQLPRLYLKKSITKKGWWNGSSGNSACLANVRL